MSKSLEELRDEYIESCDNESGSFLQRDLEKIRRKAWDAAIKAVSEREKKFIKRTEAVISFLDGINDKTIVEIEVYNSLSEALKECRGIK